MSLTKVTYAMIDGTFVNVLDYGASPSASAATNTAAFQAALDTGKGVFIPDGDYNISATLTVDTARQKIMFESRNARLVCASDITLLELNESFIEITGGTLVGGASDTTSTTSGIFIKNCTRGRFSFVDIRTFGYGIKMFDGTANWINTIESCYIYQNRRAGIYGCGHGTSIVGGEIANSEYGILMAKVQAGSALKIDRDDTTTIGDIVSIHATTIESIGNNKAITNMANNGSGLIRVTVNNHGYSTGDFVAIWGAGGTTESLGVWPITVISANEFDLKTSTFTNPYTSGGTVRRGVGVYASIATPGPIVQGCYAEDVPIFAQFGDTYQNNGTTPHSSFLSEGGLIQKIFLFNAPSVATQPQACALFVANRSNNAEVSNNYCASTLNVEIINNKDDNFGGAIASYNNIATGSGSVQYSKTGAALGSGLNVYPRTRNAGQSFQAYVPATNGSTNAVVAFQVGNFLDSLYSVACLGGLQVNGRIIVGTPQIISGSGTPEGAITAPTGSIFLATNGGAGTTLYVKESGSGNTGWVGK